MAKGRGGRDEHLHSKLMQRNMTRQAYRLNVVVGHCVGQLRSDCDLRNATRLLVHPVNLPNDQRPVIGKPQRIV